MRCKIESITNKQPKSRWRAKVVTAIKCFYMSYEYISKRKAHSSNLRESS